MTSSRVENKSQEIACQALERMEQEGVIPTPQNYEIWYRYYDGDPELMTAINRHKGPVDEAACQKLYKRYLSSAVQEELIKKISDQVHQAISELSSLFGDVKSATSEYGETIEGAGDKIDGANSLEELGSVVSAIVEDTKKMVMQNQQLEAQLNNSSSQVEELRENLDSVRKEAMTDGLTSLANRKSFDQFLNNSILEAETEGKSLTLLMLDIDHFKEFNDSYGHQVGDQVLRLVSRSLTDGIKGKDFAARYGGEEFAIVLPDTNEMAGEMVGNALRKAVEKKEVINRTTNQNLGRITMSVGVAEYHKGEVAEELIERADSALYKAKRAGRNQVARHSDRA